jgi:hypothetical protein
LQKHNEYHCKKTLGGLENAYGVLNVFLGKNIYNSRIFNPINPTFIFSGTTIVVVI